jgi:hypothetical protein
MKSYTSKQFRTCFKVLPPDIQDEARRAYRLWRVNPYHSVLQFKQVKPDDVPLYSVRIMDTGYRALGEFADDAVIWRWIGTHMDYIRLIRRGTD